uniref:Ig-like domain-containing protein n=1 Tax=Neobacillus muris TaxID=2941334 RepID=UPI00203C2021
KVKNQAPVGEDQSKETDQNVPVGGKVSAMDVAGDSVTFAKGESGPAHGTVEVSEDGSWTYTPNEGYVGEDSFTIVVTDNHGGTDTITVTVKVKNQAPVGEDQSKETDQNVPVGGKVSATDVAGDHVTFAKGESGPAHGTVEVSEDGSWTYMPSNGYVGEDSFTIVVTDAHGGTDTITVAVKVHNLAPVGEDSTNDTLQNKSASGKLTASDVAGDHVTFAEGESGPAHGTVEVSEDGGWTYTPTPGFVGEDSFTVIVTDNHGGKDTITVNMNILDQAPVAEETLVSENTFQRTPVSGDVKVTDPDGDTLTFSPGQGPENGTVTIDSGTGHWTYTPNDGYVGEDQFTIVADDKKGGTESVTIHVTVVNKVPTMNDEAVTTNENTPVNGQAQAVDPDHDTLSYQKGSQPEHGEVVVYEDGSWKYTPDTGFAGTDHFTIMADDGKGGSIEAAVSVTIIKVIDVKITIDGGEHRTTVDATPLITGVSESYDGSRVDVVLKDASGKEVYTAQTITKDGVWQVQVDSELAAQNYEVTATITDVKTKLQAVDDQTLTIKVQPVDLRMAAKPVQIIGDGKSKTTLVITLLDKDGNPVKNERVTLTAEAGTLSSTEGMTNDKGEVVVTLTSPNLAGTLETILKTVTATVHDPDKGLFASAKIGITFMPASIESQVIDSITGKPIAGALVEVHEDFNGDGVIDFNATALTDANGRYSVIVPYGNWEYSPVIKAQINFNGADLIVDIHQKAKVGVLTGTGQEVKTEKTVSGKLIFRDPVTRSYVSFQQFVDPNKVQISGKILTSGAEEVKVEVDAAGNFSITGGKPGATYDIAFEVKIGAFTLVGQRLQVTIPNDGVSAVQAALIDPYGMITDSKTGEALEGAKVTIYWADTAWNRLHGHIPNTPVELPALPGFPPGDNLVPQYTTSLGIYAWMVFPDGDYYIVAEKEGYAAYDSRLVKVDINSPSDDSYSHNGIIHVGKTVLNYDIKMEKLAVAEEVKTDNPVQTTVEQQKSESELKVLPKTGSWLDRKLLELLAALLLFTGGFMSFYNRDKKPE